MENNSYLEFETLSGAKILVEIAERPQPQNEGLEAGIGSASKKLIQKAGEKLEIEIRNVLRSHVDAVVGTIDGLANKPDEIELSFGIKVAGDTGEMASFCVGKLSGECNYSLKLKWKKEISTSKIQATKCLAGANSLLLEAIGELQRC